MEIKAKSVFNYESVKALSYITMYKRIKPKNHFYFMNIVVTFSVLMNLYMMICFGIDTQAIFFLILSVVIFLSNCYLYFIIPKIRYAGLKQMKNIVNEYVFCDEVIKITSKGEMYDGEAEIKYSMIPKVMETSEYLFIFQSNNLVFIVDKSTITGGTIDDLRRKLRPFVKKKYIIYKY